VNRIQLRLRPLGLHNFRETGGFSGLAESGLENGARAPLEFPDFVSKVVDDLVF